jgi:hypothetical protein
MLQKYSENDIYNDNNKEKKILTICSLVEVTAIYSSILKMEAEKSSQTTPTRLYDITTVKAVALHLQKHCKSRSGHRKFHTFASLLRGTKRQTK